MSRKLFVVGTGTDVGKTYVAGLILKKALESGANAAYYKPAMSGNDVGADGALVPGDAVAVKRLSASDQPLETMCSFVYKDAVSPHLAAKRENRPFDEEVARADLARLEARRDYVVLEGAGGVVCPLRWDASRKLLLIDLIASWRIPCLLVADSGLGTINGVALSARALAARGVPLRGIVLNRWTGDAMQRDNAAMCEELSGARVVAKVPEGATDLDVAPETILSLFL